MLISGPGRLSGSKAKPQPGQKGHFDFQGNFQRLPPRVPAKNETYPSDKDVHLGDDASPEPSNAPLGVQID